MTDCLICGNPILYVRNAHGNGFMPIEMFPKSPREEQRDRRISQIMKVLGEKKRRSYILPDLPPSLQRKAISGLQQEVIIA